MTGRDILVFMANGAVREDLEKAVQRLLSSGDLAGAATVGLRGYGAEIYGFLVAFHHSEEDAAEVFSRFTERLWGSLGGFQGNASFRTWLYALARNASLNYRRDARRRMRRQEPLPETSELRAIAEEVRSSTRPYLRTGAKARFAALRASLPPEDQELLILRVDRKLAWNDLARVLHERDGELADLELSREAARLRKRFQVLKERLREVGRREGLIDPEES